MAKSRLWFDMEVLLKLVISMYIMLKPNILCSNVVILLSRMLSLGRHIYFVCKPTAHCLAISSFLRVSMCGSCADRVSLLAHLSGTPGSDAALPYQYLEQRPQLLYCSSPRQFRNRCMYTSPQLFFAKAQLFPQCLLQRPTRRLCPLI